VLSAEPPVSIGYVNAETTAYLHQWALSHARCRHDANGISLAWYLSHNGKISWEVARNMECPDVHLLARSLMRAQYLTNSDQLLHETGARPVAESFTSGSLRLAYVLGGLALLSVLGFCGFLAWVIL